MGRTKGARNKTKSGEIEYSQLPTSERISLLANLMVERILIDQQSGSKLLKRVSRSNYVRTPRS